MTTGQEQRLFETYQGFDIMDTMELCQLTHENFHAVKELTGAEECHFVDENDEPTDDGQRYLWLPNDPSGEHVAVVGDYIMQDLAGHYLVLPKETVTKRYAKRV